MLAAARPLKSDTEVELFQLSLSPYIKKNLSYWTLEVNSCVSSPVHNITLLILNGCLSKNVHVRDFLCREANRLCRRQWDRTAFRRFLIQPWDAVGYFVMINSTLNVDITFIWSPAGWEALLDMAPPVHIPKPMLKRYVMQPRRASESNRQLALPLDHSTVN